MSYETFSINIESIYAEYSKIQRENMKVNAGYPAGTDNRSRSQKCLETRALNVLVRRIESENLSVVYVMGKLSTR